MPALNIMPDYPILIKIVENANTGLILAPLPLLPVIWLPLPAPPCGGPGAVATCARGGNPRPCRSPVPTILYSWLQVFPVAPREITLPAPSPDVGDVILPDNIFHPVILLLAGDGDGVHAELPAVVPGPLPVPLGIPTSLKPGEMERLSKLFGMNNS